jgi:hypothetical protein
MERPEINSVLAKDNAMEEAAKRLCISNRYLIYYMRALFILFTQ